jgi:hypothetical protein
MSTTTSMLTQPTLILSLRYASDFIFFDYSMLTWPNLRYCMHDVSTTTLLTRLTLILRLRYACTTSLRHHFADLMPI